MLQLLLCGAVAVNDPPLFTAGPSNVSVPENTGVSSSTWATSISAGPGEESQSVTFALVCTNAALFSTQPQLSPTGVLTFTSTPGAFGSSICNATLTDSEGASAPSRQFTINVLSGGCTLVSTGDKCGSVEQTFAAFAMQQCCWLQTAVPYCGSMCYACYKGQQDQAFLQSIDGYFSACLCICKLGSADNTDLRFETVSLWLRLVVHTSLCACSERPAVIHSWCCRHRC
jgi:hypothetical protein